MKIQISKIKPDPNQPRKTFKDIEGLAKTIKREGMLQPILIDSEYKIIDGERRYRAAQMIGMKEVPVVILEIKADDKKKRLIWQCISDIQHKDIPILERDKAWKNLWEDMGHPPYIRLAEIFGVDPQSVQDAIERATYVNETKNSSFQDVPASAITETRFLRDKPELRKKAIDKLTEIGTGIAHVKSRGFIQRLKEVKDDDERIEKILNEDITDYSQEADRVITEIRRLLQDLQFGLLMKIPKQQAMILSGYISELHSHLHKWQKENKDSQAMEGEIIE